MPANPIKAKLKSLADPVIAEHSQRFFKTGKGEYGEGDRFLGIRVPVLRSLVKEFKSEPMATVKKCLASPWHEERLLALFLLVHHFQRANEQQQHAIVDYYLANTHRINNWDLVDSSAHQIIGAWFNDRPRKPVIRLTTSASLWERRMAMIASYHWIKQDDFDDALLIAGRLLHDKEDLIHKAVGWMLREIGNRNLAAETEFLKPHYQTMPRTMLRYAIEKFPKETRKQYLSGLV